MRELATWKVKYYGYDAPVDTQIKDGQRYCIDFNNS